jgi:hypothetical protein
MIKNQQVDYSLVFFFIAFFIILLGLFSKLSFQKRLGITREINQVVITPQTEDGDAKLRSLNYNSPITCNFKNIDSSISAHLNNTSISLVIQQKTEVKRIIVEGDCMYSWIEKQKVGQKECGVKQYLSMGKQLLESDFASVKTIETIAKQMGKNIPVDIGAMIKSCNNVKEVNKEGFVVPLGVVFR